MRNLMHPCLTDAIALLRNVLNDPGNVPKVMDRTTRAIAEIERFGDQKTQPAQAVPAEEPEKKPRKAPEKK